MITIIHFAFSRQLQAQRKSLAAIHPLDELLLQNRSEALKESTDIDDEEDNQDDESSSLQTLSDMFSSHAVAENMTLLDHYLYSRISFQ